LPRGWKVCGGVALCPGCQRTRCRQRSITARVNECVGVSWQTFEGALTKAFESDERLLLPKREQFELMLSERGAEIRILILGDCWTLRLNSRTWSGGRLADYREMQAGRAFAMELLIFHRRGQRIPLQNPSKPGRGRIFCRITAWLPGQGRTRARPFASPLPDAPEIALMDLHKLRRAVRLNWVSFPSQVPVFSASCHETDTQRRLVQLYFVLGWSCSAIALRYHLVPHQVLNILRSWKERAVKAGYIQSIPPAAVIEDLRTGGEAFHPVPDDSGLIAGLTSADQSAYEQLLARYQDSVYNLASRLLDSPGYAAEATQAVFIRIFRNIGGLPPADRLRAWLYRLVVDECLARCSVEAAASCAKTSAMPIERALLRIDPSFRAALVLKELENMSYEEVAEVLDVPVATARRRVDLGRELLRQKLEISRTLRTDPVSIR
jgi:RNA polymerase sigma-70 factor, ECF subfamily